MNREKNILDCIPENENLDIAIFKEIFDKRYSVLIDLYIDRKHIKSVSYIGTIIEINGRYFYKFDSLDISNRYLEMLLKKLNWK